MNRKLFILPFLLISLFFGINKASALTRLQVPEISEETQEILNEFIDNLPTNEDYAIFYYGSTVNDNNFAVYVSKLTNSDTIDITGPTGSYNHAYYSLKYTVNNPSFNSQNSTTYGGPVTLTKLMNNVNNNSFSTADAYSKYITYIRTSGWSYLYYSTKDIYYSSTPSINDSVEFYNDTIGFSTGVIAPGDIIPPLKSKNVSIDISSSDNVVSVDNIDYIVSKRISLKFNNYNIFKYKTFISHNSEHGFCEIVPNLLTGIYNFDISTNGYSIVKILDRETNEVVYTTTFNHTGISFPVPSVSLSLIETEYLNNDSSLAPISKLFIASFDYFDTSRYIYKYYYPDYDSTFNMLENNKYISLHKNGSLIFYVYDKKTNELLNTQFFNINGLFGEYFPQISIKHKEFDYLKCGNDNRVYSDKLEIYFSILDSDKYIYQYSIGGDYYNDFDLKQHTSGYYFEYTVFYNSTIFVRILDKTNNEVLIINTYNVDSINYDTSDITCILGDNYNDNLRAMQQYLVSLTETSNAFNDLFHSLFDNLPSFIQLGLVFAYVVLLLFITLIMGGWK